MKTFSFLKKYILTIKLLLKFNFPCNRSKKYHQTYEFPIKKYINKCIV